MFFTLQYQPIPLLPGIPAGYENHHLHGTRTCYHVSAKATLFLQEIQLGEVLLQYLLMDLAADALGHCQLAATGKVVWICLRGSCTIPAYGSLSEGRYHLSLQEDPLITLPGSQQSVTALVILHFASDTFWLAEPHSDRLAHQPVHLHCPYLPPAMLDAAIQLIQTSYYPEPLPFHIGLVQQIGQMVLSQAKPEPAVLPAISPTDIAAIHAARKLITEPFHRPISLTEISRHCGLNREKLRTGFKALFGTTVAAYARQCRLDHAREQLIYTHKPIKEIARNAGYRSLSNFCTACKQVFGMSPGEIRKAGEV